MLNFKTVKLQVILFIINLILIFSEKWFVINDFGVNFKFIYFSKSEKLHENWQPAFQRPKDFSSLHFLMFTAGILYESAVLSNMSKRNVYWFPVGCCKPQMDCWFNLQTSPNWEGVFDILFLLELIPLPHRGSTALWRMSLFTIWHAKSRC